MKIKSFCRILTVLLCLLVLTGCKHKEKELTGYTPDNLSGNNTFVIQKDNYAAQPYWSMYNRAITKAEDGYYKIMANHSVGYIDTEKWEWNRLCSDPACVCRNPLPEEEEKELRKQGKEIPRCKSVVDCTNMLCYDKGMLYSFQGDEDTGLVYLISITTDGTGTVKRLCSVGAYDEDLTYGGWRMIIKDDYFYVYNWACLPGENDIEVVRYSKDGKQKKVIARFRGNNIRFTSVKSYGNKLFIIAEWFVRDDKGYSTHNDGIYVYDYDTGETSRILNTNVKDFAVNEEENLIYYYLEGDGLYSKPLDKKGGEEVKKLYNATDETYYCQLSYDGKYIYLNNENCMVLGNIPWSAYCTLVMKTDGTIVNRIPAGNYDTFFGDSEYFFMNVDYAEYKENGGFSVLDKSKIESEKVFEERKKITIITH